MLRALRQSGYPAISSLLLIFGLVHPAGADFFDDVDYALLESELGPAVPDGTNVSVTQVEACSGNPCAYAPDPGNTQFTGITITDGDGGPIVSAPFSSHANSMALRFFGSLTATSPGITDVSVYLADDWFTAGFLRTGQPVPPAITPSRVANHSWVGSSGDDLEPLRRLDWLVATDEFIQVAGFNATGNPLLSGAPNAISVNRTGDPTDGGSATVAGDPVYAAPRTRPDLVAPETSTSTATPRVASAAVLLVDLAHSNPLLSNGSTFNRNGDLIYDAERSEVVKAVLMAGAERQTANTTGGADIVDYRVSLADQTSNGLDRRYGAGQLNIHRSYHVMAAGEQDSREDGVGAGLIDVDGFDYDPAFGGQGSNTEATYCFSTATDSSEITLSLVWNVAIDPGPMSLFDQAAIAHDLDLYLYDATDPGNRILEGVSDSSFENTENIWTALNPERDYLVKVMPGAGQAAFDWDYALAWRLTGTLAPDADRDCVADSRDAFPTDPGESVDTDGDGTGDNADAFPDDPDETVDSDGDGVGDNADVFPGDPAETVDTDGDGTGDNADAFPADAGETTDTDGDGQGDNADSDDDADGMSDIDEARYGFDPLNAADASQDADGDGVNNAGEISAGTDPLDASDVPAGAGTGGNGTGLATLMMLAGAAFGGRRRRVRQDRWSGSMMPG